MLMPMRSKDHPEEGKMVQEVEVNSFDLRYESYRMRHEGAEKALLCSISECGIREPLEGVDKSDRRVLLNGFKRLRCARKLGLGVVPYYSLGVDEAMGIIQLIRISNSKSLTILEQARLLDDLKSVHKMSLMEIARMLERSKSWVCMRLGINEEMSDLVREKIFRGDFPVYAYMYTLRPFIRMNGNQRAEVDEFVSSVAGKKLSFRDIERLAHGYFHGPSDFREQIKKGHILWVLEKIKAIPEDENNLNEPERSMLKDLEILQKYMGKITHKGKDGRYKNNAFFAQANLLAGGILSKMSFFSRALKEFYDRSGKT